MRCKAITAAVWIGMAAMTQTGLAQQSRMATEAGATTQASAASANKINAILDRWQGVEASKGGNVALWRDIMSIQLKHVSPSTLDRLLALNFGDNAADKAQFYQSFVHVLGTDIALRLQAQKVLANTQSMADASSDAAKAEDQRRVSPQFLGDTTDDQTFIPITPCRIVDTRNVGGPIASFAARNFFFYTTDGTFNWFSNQGGVFGQASSTCPATVFGYVPSAAIATVTVTGQGGAGNLVVWGGANPVASASTMSYGASGDIANLAVVPWGGRTGTGPGGPVKDFAVFVNAFSATNVVIDVVGYYTQPQATPLDCITVNANSGTIVPGGSATVSALCTTGYQITGGGCHFFNTDNTAANDTTVVINRHSRQFDTVNQVFLNQWFCELTNNDAVKSFKFQTRAMCCRVPGR